MDKKMCVVKIGEESRCYEEGTTYREIAEEFQHLYAHPIVLVYLNRNRLQELNKELKKDCELGFLTTADYIGNQTYRRSMCLLLVKAVHDVGGHDKVERVRIHFSVSKGYYCTIEGEVALDEAFLKKVEERMRELSDQQIPIEKRSVHTNEAIELFRRHKMYDKEHLFEYR